jgi:uncharacterized membrane protein YedE/YeeE
MTLPGFPDAMPVAGLIGGALIGLAGAIMLLGLGRIAGVSGITARAAGIASSGMDRTMAWAFILGLPMGVFITTLVQGDVELSFPGAVPLAIAGVIVGFGTRMGGGCTSGHGVCGVSRFSTRSLLATITFMATGIATVAVMNALGLEVMP